MTPDRYEQLSAWMDGELDGQAEQELLDALLEDEALAATYLRWQKTRELMHHPERTVSSPPVRLRTAQQRVLPVTWVRTGWALAASVLLASMFWWSSLSDKTDLATAGALPVARVTVAAATSRPVMDNPTSVAALSEQDRLHTYMMQHATTDPHDTEIRLLNYVPVVARVEPGREVAGDDSQGAPF